MYDTLSNSTQARKEYPVLPAEQAHHAAQQGSNTGAQSALPKVPGHSVPAGSPTTPITITSPK